MDDLSDVTLEINTNEIGDICNNWNQSVSSVDIDSINIDQIFSPLTDLGIAKSYVSSLEETIKEMNNLVSTVSSAIKTTAENQSTADETISNNITENYNQNTSNDNNVESAGNNYTGSASNNYVESTSSGTYTSSSGNFVDYTSSTKTEKKVSIKASEPIYKELDDMSYKDSIEFVKTLRDLRKANTSLLDYLKEHEKSTEIKTALTKQDLSDRFKTTVEEMNPDELQKAIYYYFTEKSNISDITKKTLIDEIMNYNLDSVISAKELLRTLIKDSNAANEMLLSILESNDINKNIIDKYNTVDNTIFKNIINEIANDINPNQTIDESFLNIDKEEVTKRLEQSIKDLNIISTIGYTDVSDCEQILSRLLNIE